ncbi:MAG: tRNA preQ1(34) S-adenosylmethionine ribosyltransferase-isomerase QueA [Planctomycetota bacterium]|jgi:S-adenosylmethionine:tRNA ribosyltransferase-isomerase
MTPEKTTTETEDYAIGAFDYELPQSLIAQQPAEKRDKSRLMILDRAGNSVRHAQFGDITEFFRPGDLLVLNATKVFPARIFGKRSTGGNVEILFLRTDVAGGWLALVRGKVKAGETVELAGGAFSVTVAEPKENGWRVEAPDDLPELLEKHGVMPLPPYITRGQEENHALDHERYQTVYAKETGSAAAPTAGLHFTPGLFETLKSSEVETAEVVLHIGYETFRPIRAGDVREHVMHGEFFEVDSENAEKIAAAAKDGKRIIPVGTTSMRVLETLAIWDAVGTPVSGMTSIYIKPPFDFRLSGALVTNFHLPRSSLLVLVSAFAGRNNILAAYAEAVKKGYRFYSYGDAMIIL